MSKATDRFVKKKWGVFSHYLNGLQNGGSELRNPSGRKTDFNEFINEFDTDLLAENLHKMGAGYFCITLMQATKYMIAPNATFDKLAGTKPGEACSHRDLVEDLYHSLAKYDIDLYLYFSADGPWMDTTIEPALVLGNPRPKVTEQFVKDWASVMQEYADRYGEKIKGWWIDSCYKWLGFDDDNLKYYYDALKHGNPDTLLAFNVSGTSRYRKGYCNEDYVCGERNDFEVLPLGRITDGVQSHVLAPIGIHPTNTMEGAWAFPGVARDKEYMLRYIQRAKDLEIPVTVDIMVYRDGSIDKEQQELLEFVGNNLK